jgi:geranylgeranyl diphosphate synthase type II
MEHLQHQIEQGLLNFCKQLPHEPNELYEPISYTLSLGGKRIRPLFVMLGCELFDGNTEQALPAALAVEVFHNFTLLHDDLMDLAPLRRNKPTVYKKWNSNIAILAGDAMFVKSCELIAQTKTDELAHILQVFNQTALGVCEGQQFDMNFESTMEVSIDQYIKMIELKTAVLLAGGIQIGAIIANANHTDAKNLYEFAKNIGIAFQLQDDILDVYGDPEKFGKQVGGDIISNKKTFLLIKAIEMADEKQKEKLFSEINKVDYIAQEKVNNVTAIYDELGVKQQAQKAMQAFYNKALQFLDAVNATKEKKETLKNLAHSLMNRQV